MLILRIRQAECALGDGRLDEAFELAQPEDVRRHRRGQKLIRRVVEALVQRGRDHLEGRRLAQALADCEKASRLGGNTSQIAALRADIAQTMADQQQSGQEQGKLLGAARKHIDNGRLTMGQQLLNEAPEETARVAGLQQEVAHRRDAAESVCRKVRAALDRDDWSSAIDELLWGQRAKLSDTRLSELTARVTKLVVNHARTNIVEGRLDLAENLMNRLGALAAREPETQELTKVLRQCRKAGRLIERNQPHQAGRIFRRLGSILPTARWVERAVRSCESAASALETLRSGPVGLLLDNGPESIDLAPEVEEESVSAGAPRQNSQVEPSGDALPGKFLIQVDGVGSFLVVRSVAVTIGPISSPERPEVGLLADPDLPVVSIERADEDYFLRCDQPVAVNDRPVTERLLADGDRIALSPRCRWRFVRPNPASNSAVLDLSGARLPQGDTRKVILLDREVIIGPGSTGHIRADQCRDRVVLHVRSERLLCRSESPMEANGRSIDPARGVPLGVPVRIGSISLVITPA